MSEEPYWIIPSVCTYRDFTEENFDECIDDTFFMKGKYEQKNDEQGIKNNDSLCKRQKSTISLDSGVEDKESADRYSIESNSSNSEQMSSNELVRNCKKQKPEELLIRLNEIKNKNKNIEIKPKPKLQLRNSQISCSPQSCNSPDINVPLDSATRLRKTSRIMATPEKRVESKYARNVPVLSVKRSYSIEKVPFLTKSKVCRSNSLNAHNASTLQSFTCKSSPLKKTIPVAKCLSSKISNFFSSARRSRGRATSEPPKCDRTSKIVVNSQISDVKVNKITTNLGSQQSNEQKKGRLSKGKIANIIERLSKAKK